ncbi:MAG TPA: hypothetical protein VM101_09475 [Flavitalea sp.]|nr:hypothetical protein [Flavitalea sp.]
MYTGLVHLHNFLRWVVLVLLIVAIVRHLMGMTSRKTFTSGDKKADLLLMISTHIQLLVGLIIWFIGDWGYQIVKNSAGMGEVMKNSAMRFWVIEHPLGMLVATALITVGRGVSKKLLPDAVKHKKIFWFFFIALIIIIASVPWAGRTGIGRPLF